MVIGTLSVMTGGTAEMLKLCVGNLTLMDVSNSLLVYNILSCVDSLRYPLHTS